MRLHSSAEHSPALLWQANRRLKKAGECSAEKFGISVHGEGERFGRTNRLVPVIPPAKITPTKKPPSQAARELEAGQAAFFLILALTAVALRFM